jgi:hypothetical protein
MLAGARTLRQIRLRNPTIGIALCCARAASGHAKARAAESDKVRVGWFRSVNNVAHAWAIQSFVAEIANQLGRDPKDFLLELIGPARIVTAPEKTTTPWWTMANRTTLIRWTLDGSGGSLSLWPRKPAGDGNCPRLTGSASRRIVAW